MTNLGGVAVPSPANEQEWESWVQHLGTIKYGVAVNAYGRRGQKQDGLDFTVSTANSRIGIQCKFVSPHSKLDVAQVAKDIEASKAVRPPINHFVLFSSALSDTTTGNALDELKPGAFEAGIAFEWFLWRDFEEQARTHGIVPRLYGIENPTLPTKASGALATSRPVTEGAGLATQTTIASSSAVVLLYSGMLDSARRCLSAGNTAGALAVVDAVLLQKDKVPGAELAKAYATKAILIGRGGGRHQSAKFWNLAAEIEPNPDLRHGRKAQMFLSKDNWQEALNASLPGLQVDPPSPLSAIAALVAGQRLGRRVEIDALISARLKSDRDVSMVRAHVALADRDLMVAKELSVSLLESHPDDLDVVSLRADILLTEALGGPGRLRVRAVTGLELSALEAATGFYKKVLAGRDPFKDREAWLPAALNCVSALKLLDRHDDAAEIALDITNAFGVNIEDAGRLLLILAEGGKQARALELVSHCSKSDTKMLMAKASALMHQGRFADAVTSLNAALLHADAQEADNIRWMVFAARMQSRPNADIEKLAEEFFDAANNKLSACGRIVENAGPIGKPQLLRIFAERAIALYQSAPDSEYLPVAADSFIALDLLDEASRLLLQQVELTNPTGGVLEERLAFCLLRLRRIESLGLLLSGLSEKALDTDRFDPYRIDYELARGDRSAALMAVQNAISRRRDDFKLQAVEIALLRELGKVDEARQKLRTAIVQVGARLHAISLFVQNARAMEEHDLADAVAYQWIRKNANHSDNAAWYLSDFLIGRPYAKPIEPMSKVSSQCGVFLKPRDNTASERWIVLDDRYDEDVVHGWHSLQSLPQLSGATLGSVVELVDWSGGPFTVCGIVPVIEGAYLLVGAAYGHTVPMSNAMRVVRVVGDDGNVDISPILKMLEDDKATTQNVLSAYSQTPIPVGVVAQQLGRSPLDVWAGLVNLGTPVRAMSGDAKSITAFTAAIRQEAPDIVLDPVTLFAWDTLGILEQAAQSVRSIAMTTSGVDVIRRKRSSIEVTKDREKSIIYAGDADGIYVRADVTPEQSANSLQALNRLLDWIQNRVTEEPVPPSGLPEEVYASISLKWPAYIADSMQLAAHSNKVVVADDLGLEAISAACQIRQVPTLALVRAAVENGLVGKADLTYVLQIFAQAKYDFISYSPLDLWAATDDSRGAARSAVATLLRYLNSHSLDLASGCAVVCAYLQMLSEGGIDKRFFAGCLTISLSALTRDATRETQSVFVSIATFCENRLPRPYSKKARDAMLGWLSGHFLSLQDVGLQDVAKP